MKRLDLTDFLGFPAEITWDSEAWAIYLKVSDLPVNYTEIGATTVDYSRENKIVGVEVLL